MIMRELPIQTLTEDIQVGISNPTKIKSEGTMSQIESVCTHHTMNRNLEGTTIIAYLKKRIVKKWPIKDSDVRKIIKISQPQNMAWSKIAILDKDKAALTIQIPTMVLMNTLTKGKI